MYFRQSSLNPIRLACLPSEDPPTHLKKVGYFPPLISSPLNHLRYVIASETEWNEAIAADSAITSLRYRCVRNDKYLSKHDITPFLRGRHRRGILSKPDGLFSDY